jgi:hypothetical protein
VIERRKQNARLEIKGFARKYESLITNFAQNAKLYTGHPVGDGD